MDSNKSALSNLIYLLRPHKRIYIVIIICVFIASALGIFIPIINKMLIDEGIAYGNYKLVIICSVCLLLIAFANHVLDYIRFALNSKINNSISYKLYYWGYKHLFNITMDQMTDKSFGNIIRDMEIDINYITKITDSYMVESVVGLFKVIGGLTGLVLLNWKLSLCLVVIIPVKVTITNYYYKMRGAKISKWIDAESAYSSWYNDSLSGLSEIKLWGLHNLKLNELKHKMKNIYRSKYTSDKADKQNKIVDSMLESSFINLFIYIIGSAMIFSSDFTIGGLFSFVSYASLVFVTVAQLINVRLEFALIEPSLKRYIDFLNTSEESCHKLVLHQGESVDENYFKSVESIEFKNICYKISDRVILNDISLKLTKGTKVAIVGHNGSGKTTFINMLLRFIKPSSGSVCLNGVEVSSIKLKRYRELFSVMTQRSYLFNATIKNNIDLLHTMDEERIRDVSMQTGVDELIAKSYKYDAENVGNNGDKLSGGEKQKVAIARTLYKFGRILIFDEATSNLDYNSEKVINNLIFNDSYFDIIIAISHSKDILNAVDTIIFLSEGEVLSIGSYSELIKNSVFKEYIESPRITV